MGAAVTSAGALVSVSGSDESGMLGTARLSYAMAVDGLFPKFFARVHSKFKTPYVALMVQGIIALALSLFSRLGDLISFAVFNLAFSFLLVSLSFAVLKKDREKGLYGQRFLPWLGVAICLYLLYSAGWVNIIIGSVVVLIGIPVYIYFSPKTHMHPLKEIFVSESAILARNLDRKYRFLANGMRLVAGLVRRIRRKRT